MIRKRFAVFLVVCLIALTAMNFLPSFLMLMSVIDDGSSTSHFKDITDVSLLLMMPNSRNNDSSTIVDNNNNSSSSIFNDTDATTVLSYEYDSKGPPPLEKSLLMLLPEAVMNSSLAPLVVFREYVKQHSDAQLELEIQACQQQTPTTHCFLSHRKFLVADFSCPLQAVSIAYSQETLTGPLLLLLLLDGGV